MYDATLDLMNRWICSNVYPKTRKTVQKLLDDKLSKLKHLKDYPKQRKGDTYWKEYSLFISECKQLFDILGDNERIKRQEKLWGIKMTEKDWLFYENMKFERQIGYYGPEDPKWAKTELRKQKTQANLRKRKAEAAEYESNMSMQSTSTSVTWVSQMNMVSKS